jgi:hypothetical protein
MTLNLTNLKLQFTIYHHHLLIFFFGGWQGAGAEEGFAKKTHLLMYCTITQMRSSSSLKI